MHDYFFTHAILYLAFFSVFGKSVNSFPNFFSTVSPFFYRNKVSEISKSVEAVNESCKNARFSLDLHYQKIKLEVMKAIDGHYHSLVDYIERANKKDIDLLLGIKNQFLSDLDLATSLISKGNTGADREKILTLAFWGLGFTLGKCFVPRPLEPREKIAPIYF